MRLINQTKNTILAEEVFFANTGLKRLKGLLGKKELPKGKALIIKPCSSVHSFFMQFTIDLIFLDEQNRVIKTIPYFRPFRITRPYFHAVSVVELPSGTIDSSLTQITDSLSLE
ncbi:MAG: DUF192 domain-containing protein [Candidatus Omnitrophica bacterium]|nr:DUF192 domain-containing protein [Candidatus Omnitrophota bacterium]